MAASPKIAEKNLWAWLRGGKVSFGLDLHIQRIESNTALGIPDVEGCLKVWPASVSFWTELKAAARPVRATTQIKHNVTADQVSWHRKRYHAGGVSNLLLQIGSGNEAKKYLVNSSELLAFQKPITEAEIASISKDVTQWPPNRVLAACAGLETQED